MSAIDGIGEALAAARSFVEKLAGPAAEEVGSILQDQLRLYRLKNQLRMLEKAREMLSEAGVSPQAVPLRLLLPLLDGAALEDDDNLSSKWSALLANSADPELRAPVHPSFVRVLSELSPKDALILDQLWERAPEVLGYDNPRRLDGLYPEHFMQRNPFLRREEVELLTENLIRLQLCATRTVAMRAQPDPISGDREILLTYFGRRLLFACQPPTDLPLEEKRQ